jgi:hypothetical protein
MRLVVKKYASGGTNAFETTNDGGEVIKEEGAMEFGRISAYLEALCDDTVEGADRLLTALAQLTAKVQERRKAFAEKKPEKPKRSRSKRAVPSDQP